MMPEQANESTGRKTDILKWEGVMCCTETSDL